VVAVTAPAATVQVSAMSPAVYYHG
jgi:hypothetical protein